uniref:Uncharacterized protein n=1 Tax=Panagrellus redivivus TaxID=6233 RepID=A0A7E4VCU0_PANRE
MDLTTLLPALCLINSVKGNIMGDCATPRKVEDKEHYYRYSVPGEYFHILENAPEINRNAIQDENLKAFMKKMPIENANRASIFGHFAQGRDRNFKVFFGDETTPVFWLGVADGTIVYENYELPTSEVLQHDLPQYFVLTFEFLRNSVKVGIYKMPDADPVVTNICLPYRTLGVDISHMAIFAQCDGISFHMVNLEEYPLNSKLCATTREGANNKVGAYDPQKSTIKAKLIDGSDFLEPITGYFKTDSTITFYHSSVRPMSIANFVKSGVWFTDC